jgi:hypothetical protein
VTPHVQPTVDRGVAAAVRRHPLAAYFVLTYLFSWSYWIP